MFRKVKVSSFSTLPRSYVYRSCACDDVTGLGCLQRRSSFKISIFYVFRKSYGNFDSVFGIEKIFWTRFFSLHMNEDAPVPRSPLLKRSASSPIFSCSKMSKSDQDSDSDSDHNDHTMLEADHFEVYSKQKVPKKFRMRSKATSSTEANTDFSVVLEDVGGDNDPHFKSYGQFTCGLFKSIAVNDVSYQRRLSPGKWLIYFKSKASQEKLLETTDLAGIKIRCSILQKCAVGVIKPVPVGISMEQIKASCPEIKDAFRLKTKDGNDSAAIKLVFKDSTLPQDLHIGNEIMPVNVFVEPVIRCSKCQRIGHRKSACKAKLSICPRCGKQAHDPDNPQNNIQLCSASENERFCINCKSTGHSAAWKGCPMVKLQQKTNAESAKTGIPRGIVKHAIQVASKESTNENYPLMSTPKATSNVASSSSTVHQFNLDYSAVVKGTGQSMQDSHTNQIHKNENSLLDTVTIMFKSLEKKMDEKMQVLEVKLQANFESKRQEQLDCLKSKVDSITVSNPLKHIAANIVKNVVLASEGNSTPLVELITNLVTNRSPSVSSSFKSLVWDKDLEHIVQLAIPSFVNS